ncbi:MAG: helix-turn-helix domain-containing protein [Anaeroplasmataceae bacterium]|nr:helix-turn-helix domain-containing protein [Anaeroplasmataceae bacterium]MDE6414783.1 helix-turn-helix domain-containing protein [Anaeroplasmataceae bacterium]
MNNLKIGSFLQALRKAKGLTQADVAEYFEISPKTVSKWECGDALPEVPMLKALAEYYDVTVDEILSGEKGKAEESSKIRVEHNNYLYQKKNKLLTVFFVLSLGLVLIAFILFRVLYQVIESEHNVEIAQFTYSLISCIAGVIFIISLYILGSGQNDFEPSQCRKFKRKKYTFLYIVIAAILFGFISHSLGLGSYGVVKYFLILFGVLVGFGVIGFVLWHSIYICKKNE